MLYYCYYYYNFYYNYCSYLLFFRNGKLSVIVIRFKWEKNMENHTEARMLYDLKGGGEIQFII